MAQVSLKLSGDVGTSVTMERDIVSIDTIIRDMTDLSQSMWSSLTRRAGREENAGDVGGAALGLRVQEARASVVGGGATTTAAAVTTAAAAATTATTAVVTTAVVVAAASSRSGNGERGHEGEKESGQLHFGGGNKTQSLKDIGVNV